ncbi:MAG: hypothetical protein ACRD5Z_15750 [Bryobacteraceae bacterium]
MAWRTVLEDADGQALYRFERSETFADKLEVSFSTTPWRFMKFFAALRMTSLQGASDEKLVLEQWSLASIACDDKLLLRARVQKVWES